ncbi:MAG: 4Fe-4S dicluster domain-containing protein [Firmicutes bacterium]|nr:4Fe-4S dicluster domain-containing protein [Bacillota bacterium]
MSEALDALPGAVESASEAQAVQLSAGDFAGITKRVQEIVRALLESGEVGYVLGWQEGTNPYALTPCFMSKPEDSECFRWNPLCVSGLPNYLLDDRTPGKKIGVVIRGCDSRAVIRLLQDRQAVRENLVLIGIPCTGVVDPRKAAVKARGLSGRVEEKDGQFLIETSGGTVRVPKAELLRNECLVCRFPNPLLHDRLVAREVEAVPVASEARFARVNRIEVLSAEEKANYWNSQFERCLRCYACRQACPACYCRECIFDMDQPCWVNKLQNLEENRLFHVIRAFHVAGRCAECGECERVCPVGIPLQELNQKLVKEIADLFGTDGAAIDLGAMPPLGCYSHEDPDEFN